MSSSGTSASTPASTIASAGQSALQTIESGAIASAATVVTALTALGGTFVGQTAENFGNFVTSYSQAVQANPTQSGIYTSAFNEYWPVFVAAEENNIDNDLATAIGVVAQGLDSVFTAIANAGSGLASLL